MRNRGGSNSCVTMRGYITCKLLYTKYDWDDKDHVARIGMKRNE
jgi:hypothetical protein